MNQQIMVVITNDCQCEHDAHEMRNYPREGLTVQSFKAGDKLALIETWSNFYGDYYRVVTEKGYADISTRNAKPAPAEAANSTNKTFKSWTVYNSPSDIPGQFVAREFDLDKPTEHHFAHTDRAKVDEWAFKRAELAKQARPVCIERFPADDACILYTWI